VPVDAVPEQLRANVQTGEALSIETDDVTAVVHALSTWAVENGASLDSLAVVRPNLEDTFLRLTDEPTSSDVEGAN
jgi:hypothetical protein